MRDLLPAEAEAQGRLASKVLSLFELHGYQQVVVPAVEYAEVLSKGSGALEAHSMLRFIESETGEVVALRPDMTPQIARLVATRLKEKTSPARISYRGSVLRRQHERARHDQQSLQAGIELIGVEGVSSDLEVISVCVQAVRDSGLDSFVLDLGHGGIAAALVAQVEESQRGELLEALSLKDTRELSRRAQSLGLSSEAKGALVGLLSLQGGPEVFRSAQAILGSSPAWPLVQELETLYERTVSLGIAPKVVVDLGETSAVAYYTGPTFQVLAEGPGRPVASGGRYDALYAHFGSPRPAAGGAIQLDHLRWALGDKVEGEQRRVLVVSAETSNQPCVLAEKALAFLRDAGLPCVWSPGDSALAYARAWRYSHILRVGSATETFHLSAIRGEQAVELGHFTSEEILNAIRP